MILSDSDDDNLQNYNKKSFKAKKLTNGERELAACVARAATAARVARAPAVAAIRKKKGFGTFPNWNRSNLPPVKQTTITELNRILHTKCRNIAKQLLNIELSGEIKPGREWKNGSGISFKIMENKQSFDCKMFERSSGMDVAKVKKFVHTTCTIRGNIEADNYFGHDFKIIVREITQQIDDSKFKKLKEECEKKGYFQNKKNIDWKNINIIGIISKNGTQGYIDFKNQLYAPLDKQLEEIALEGNTTSKQLIKAINNLQDVDLILIIRGGGDTSSISNSFDKIEIFDAIKKSKKPIITAIGHAADKNDKLLITQISDCDFSTPSTAAYEMTNMILKPILEKLEYSILDKIDNKVTEKIENMHEKKYKKLDNLMEKYMKQKFGWRIVDIDDDEEGIIIQKDGKFYKEKFTFAEEVSINEEDKNFKDEIECGIDEENINIIEKNFKNLNKINNKMTKKIEKHITEIKDLDKQLKKYENIKARKMKKLYCKQYKQDISDIKTLTQWKRMFLWYTEILETNFKDINDNDEKEKIFKYLKHLF